MNVYACCYRGNLGYGCRIRGRRWMFVPEFGQPDHRIHRDLSLADLTFANAWAQGYERELEQPRSGFGIAEWLRRLPVMRKTHGAASLLCNVA